jgi:hypothetical protein
VERSNIIDAALREASTEDAFRRLVHDGLRAKGVSPDAPHGRVDVEWFSPERHARLQAGGSALRAYNLLGDIRSPAVVGTGVGTVIGLVLTGGSVLLNPEGHPHAARDLAVGAGTGAVGGYLGGQAEFALNARWVRAELTAANAPLGTGLRQLVLPRVASGGVAGVLTAPVLTWTVMGVDEACFGADYRGGGGADRGRRWRRGWRGRGGRGADDLPAGGAAAGWEVPVLGSLVGALGGLATYHVVDWLCGDKVERSVRTAVGDHLDLARKPRSSLQGGE